MDLLKDHEWPSLASKLPQRNYVSKNNGGPDRVETRTCYKCNKVGHPATNFPDKTEKTSNVSGTKKTEPAGAAREEKVLASCKYIESKDISVNHKMMKDESRNVARNASAKQLTKRGSFS
jgi:hypothetical protein